MAWQDHMIDTHVAAPHSGHVPSAGNASQEPSGPPGLPGWLIQRMAEESARKREQRALMEQAGYRLRQVEAQDLASDFLRSKGHSGRRIK